MSHQSYSTWLLVTCADGWHNGAGVGITLKPLTSSRMVVYP